jgi:DNA-binding GntR family transcriptional regulator
VRNRDADAMIESNRGLHLAIAEACGNGFVTAAYARLLTVGLRLSRLLVTYDTDQNRDVPLATHLDRIIDQHREMEVVIAARDADAAEQLGGSHAQLSLDRAAATLRNTLSGAITLPKVS